ncbi:MAG TPA: VOC family protein [Actinomycetota bacterium]|nr:VOC family protein [Actinomycetota bacterium]
MDRMYVGSVVIDVNDISKMRAFWQEALAYELAYEAEDDWVKLVDPNEKGVSVSLQLVPERRTEKNRLHLDLYASDPMREVERLEGLGAERVRGPEEDTDFVVLADPEGNLFCVIDKSATG